MILDGFVVGSRRFGFGLLESLFLNTPELDHAGAGTLTTLLPLGTSSY
jgi:hypothetical protein